MPSIIIYSTDKKYLDRTIDGILDSSSRSYIDEIIVCDDTGEGYTRKGIKVLVTKNIGRARAWNQAAAASIGKQLVFIRDKTKPSVNWLSQLNRILEVQPKALVSPVVYTLDLNLWTTEVSRWKRFGWRWDLNLHDRAHSNNPDSPAISSHCIACTKEWFDHIDGFDDGMGPGSGEDVELSLKSWLLGGSVLVCDDASIAVALEVDRSSGTINNLARIVEAWMPAYATHFYNANNINHSQVVVGRLTNLVKVQEKQTRSIEWFLATKQPELLGIYNLKSSASKKNIAIVGPGPSLDYLNSALINRHDIIIGVDYAGLLFDCDYVMTDVAHIAIELQKNYSEQKFVVPIVLQNRIAGEMTSTSELLPSAIQFEMAPRNSTPISLEPPFCDLDNMVLTAIQFALFLNPESVTVYGCDNKIVGGKSHTSKSEYYDDGKLWVDNENTKRQFALYEYGIDQLGRLAIAAGIPLLRVSHA